MDNLIKVPCFKWSEICCHQDVLVVSLLFFSTHRDAKREETFFDKNIEKAFMQCSKGEFEKKTKPSLHVATNVGNMYTPSLYGGLASLIARYGITTLYSIIF